VELDGPRRTSAGGVLGVRTLPSDDHLATGDIPLATFPIAAATKGRHRARSRAGVRSLEVATTSSLVHPGCGKCRWCASGQQNLATAGLLASGSQMDGTYRMHIGDTDVAQARS